jgi:hypothetical protein
MFLYRTNSNSARTMFRYHASSDSDQIVFPLICDMSMEYVMSVTFEKSENISDGHKSNKHQPFLFVKYEMGIN